MSNILKAIINEAHYPEDPDEWKAMFGTKRKPLRQDPDDMREPNDPMDDHYRRQDAAQEKYKKEVDVKWINKEGTAPNGERYNSAFIVKSKTASQGDNEIYKFNDLHWGAKKIVDTVKKSPSEEGEPYNTIVYYVDNHKYGHFKPWKDQQAVSKGIQFETELMREGISQENLAVILYNRLEMRYPDIVTRYGHEVVANAVMDVAGFHAGAEELGSSDMGIMIREIIKKLEDLINNEDTEQLDTVGWIGNPKTKMNADTRSDHLVTVAESKSAILEGVKQVDEINWKRAVPAVAFALAGLGAASNAQARDLSNYDTGYLQKVASGEGGRALVSIDDAKQELQARANGKQIVIPASSQPIAAKAPSGYSKEYLEKAADPNRYGRYLISVEKAQELLNDMP